MYLNMNLESVGKDRSDDKFLYMSDLDLTIKISSYLQIINFNYLLIHLNGTDMQILSTNSSWMEIQKHWDK